MYRDFAQVYDDLMKEINYKEWSNYIFRNFLNAQKEIKTVLEFGCGTGNITSELAKMGYEVTAVDLSEDMLSVADEKAQSMGLNNIRFYLGDMSDFQIGEKYDAVISCCDTVNYLPDLEAFQRFIDCATDALNPQGILTFDMNTKRKYRDVIQDKTFVYDLEDVYCVWENIPDYDQAKVDFDLSFFIQEESGLYRRYDERQSQHIFLVEDIYKLLKRKDLTNQKVYNFGTFLSGGNDHERVQFWAEKK